MHIKCLPLGDYQTNCYLVWGADSQSCVVIDPGYEGRWVLEQVAALGLTVEAVFLTHGHFDHVGGVETIVDRTGCSLWMNREDWAMASDGEMRWLFPLIDCGSYDISFYCHGDTVCAGGLCFTVWETPGHTPGSVCLACGDTLFTGDTLFAGSIGRTDFPGSNHKTMVSSLRFLKGLSKDYTLLSGHGPSSTLFAEKLYNPFLR